MQNLLSWYSDLLRAGLSGDRMPIPVAARFKAWVCGRSPAEIAGSNPVGSVGMDVYGVFIVQ